MLSQKFFKMLTFIFWFFKPKKFVTEMNIYLRKKSQQINTINKTKKTIFNN